jgi:hypothetical protein
MDPRKFVILAWAVLAASALAAPTTQSAGPQHRAAELIAQLQADEWAVRQRAEDELVRLGIDVMPHVREAAARATDLEVRTRLRTVLARIEHDRAVGGTTITLDFPNATAQEVLAEISRQCGALVRLSHPRGAGDPPRHDFTFDREPFWSAMARVCEVFDLFPSESGDNARGLVLSGGSGWQLKSPRAVHGPFIVLLRSVHHSHSVHLAQPQAIQSSSSLQMLVMAEPKLTILGRSYMPQVDVAVNEHGQSLAMPSEYSGKGGGGTRVWSVSMPLQPLAAKSRKIATFKGSISAVVQLRAQTLEVNNLADVREQSYTIGPRRIILHEMAEQGEQQVLRVTIFHTRQEMFDGLQSLVQGVRVFDEKGRPFQMGGISNRNIEEDRSEIDIHIARQSPDGAILKKPAKLVWTVPIETRELQIPFEFHDIPLQ